MLLGDRIRMGYQEAVRTQLAETARVWGPPASCGSTRDMLGRLKRWVLDIDPPPDVVYFNCGLEDLVKRAATGEPAVPLSVYEDNLLQILGTIREHTAATVLVAATTPVSYQQQLYADRECIWVYDEADVPIYNDILIRVAGSLAMPVDDLYQVVTTADEILLSEDGVLLTPAGYEVLGGHVAETVSRYL